MNTQVENLRYPILLLKNAVGLPHKVTPVRVGRLFSIRAVEVAQSQGSFVFAVSQRNADVETPSLDDVYKTGVLSKVVQFSREKDGSLKILIEGVERANLAEFVLEGDYYSAVVSPFKTLQITDNHQNEATLRQVIETFGEYCTAGQKVSSDIVELVKEIGNLEELVDTIAVQINLDLKQTLEVLETADLYSRAVRLCAFMLDEIEVFKAEKNVKKRVLKQIEKHQRDYYLNEQMRAIYRELGREDSSAEIEALRKQADDLKLPADAKERVLSECKKLEQMQPNSPEAAVSRNYIDWLLALPWHAKTRDSVSMADAEKILNKNHFGMKKIKERIIEFIASKKFAGDKMKKSPILCLVGPPGVGKTSLAESISQALGRKFVRISLGGLRDEAEIRGHRRTYIGATAGKIIQAMKKAKVVNPVILLDEIDKMSSDLRGDPAAALLEALDPEQNKNFTDHMIEIEYDLSKVMFVTTANLIDGIPSPLLDRMELISVSGYTSAEKYKIATEFLVPKIASEHGLEPKNVFFEDGVIEKLIEAYTREAGVRQLTRVLSKLIRRSIVRLLDQNAAKKDASVKITSEDISSWLGYERYKPYTRADADAVGVSTGMAAMDIGGEILEIEVSTFKGKGALTLTGQLGEVLQESAQAALSFIRTQEKELGLKPDFYSKMDIHVHVPEGATPKDGPSAGIAIATALLSALTREPVLASVAMTGEITLRGKVLPVGGLKEKLMAAVRYGISKVVVPLENKAEILEFLPEIKSKDFTVVYVDKMKDVLPHAFASKAPKVASVVAEKTTKRTTSEKAVAKVSAGRRVQKDGAKGRKPARA